MAALKLKINSKQIQEWFNSHPNALNYSILETAKKNSEYRSYIPHLNYLQALHELDRKNEESPEDAIKCIKQALDSYASLNSEEKLTKVLNDLSFPPPSNTENKIKTAIEASIEWGKLEINIRNARSEIYLQHYRNLPPMTPASEAKEILLHCITYSQESIDLLIKFKECSNDNNDKKECDVLLEELYLRNIFCFRELEKKYQDSYKEKIWGNCNALIELNPNNALAYYYRGVYSNAQGDYSSVISDLELFIQKGGNKNISEENVQKLIDEAKRKETTEGAALRKSAIQSTQYPISTNSSSHWDKSTSQKSENNLVLEEKKREDVERDFHV